MEFASDNTAPAHPKVIEALARANDGPSAGYGADALMDEVRSRLHTIFEAPQAAIYLVATGTAANALALATLTRPWQAIFCHEHAHIATDECGAPEFYTGGSKLIGIPGAHGKIDPVALRNAIAATGEVGVHGVQRGALSLTNATESGTVYTAGETAELCAIARDFGLPVHLDGARFANALVAQNASPADLTWRAGVDALSFGGTKNGLLGVEAVVFFDPAHAWEFELRRKRGGHLFSKHRYLSAQMLAYLTDALWLDLARQANAQARALAAGLAGVKGAVLTHPVEANAVFIGMPRRLHKKAHAAGAHYYLWPFDQSLEGDDDEVLTCRLVCSFATKTEEITRFIDLLHSA